MNFIEYSPLALRTAKPFPHEQQVKHALLGILTELGELADAVKRHAVYGVALDAPGKPGKSALRINIVEEVADTLWYINLWMVEKGIGGRVVDDVWAKVSAGCPKQADTLAKLEADPWLLVDTVIALQLTVAALNVEADERGGSDVETLQIACSILFIFLLVSGHTLDQAMTRNIDKLAERYGDKYSDYNALNRDTAAEAEVLKGAGAQAS